jgi:hypothetical protein
MATIIQPTEFGKNTPKINDGSSSGKIPGNFKIISFVMQNVKGETADIRNLLDNFSITEELFSPVITLTATIRDSINFFEDFGIVGQERIVVNIKKLDAGNSTKENINHVFYVKEYPNFNRTLDFPATQIYTLVAISSFAYTSNLFTICRAIKGNVIDNLKKIYTDDLNIKTVVTDSGNTKCSSEFDGIITIQTPLSAADWLRSRAFDSEGSPFFMYSRVNKKDTIYLHSWRYLAHEDEYRKYYYRQRLEKTPGTEEAYEEQTTRILSMKSNLRLDKLSLSKQGAYASRLNVIDYATKAFYTRDYSASEGNSTVVDSSYYKIKNSNGQAATKQLDETPNASISALQINTAKPEGGKANSTTAALLDNALYAKSFLANMNEANHEISVYGDPNLNPGKKINLTIPKAIKEPTSATVDEALSGDYIITVSSHVFIEGIYINRLKLVKNVLATGKTSSGTITSSSQGNTNKSFLKSIFSGIFN